MGKLINIGDLHLTFKEPFIYAGEDFFKWLSESEYNSSANYLHLAGDITDESATLGEVNYIISDFLLNKSKFKLVFVEEGNHTIIRKEDGRFSSVIKFLESFNNVKVIKQVEKIKLENTSFLCLPFYRSGMFNLPPMKEYYQDLPKEFADDTYDYIFGHYNDETETMYGDFIDTSYLKGNRRLGHIHISKSKNYVQTPWNTRFTEKGKKSCIDVIDLITKELTLVEVLKLIDYYDVVYPNPMQENVDAKYPIWDIYNSPDEETSKLFYGKKYYHSFYLKEEQAGKLNEENSLEKRDIISLYTDFCSTSDYSEKVKNKVLAYLKKEA